MLQEELESLIDLKQRQEEFINEIKENPKKMEEYFEKAPYFFTTIWLMYRKYKTEFVFTSFLSIKDNISGYSTDFIYSFCKYYFNYDTSKVHLVESIDETQEKYEKFFNNYLLYEIDTLQDLLNFFEFYEASIESGYPACHVVMSTDFKYHFIIPIYEGKYDYHLEKLAKKSLLNLTLKEGQ